MFWDNFSEEEMDAIELAVKQKKPMLIKNKHFSNNSKELVDILTGKDIEMVNGYSSVQFLNCHITDLRAQGISFPLPFEFKNCCFYGETIFDKCVFQNQISFEGSKLSNQTTFKECQFDANANFNRVENPRRMIGRGFIMTGTSKQYTTEKISFREAKLQCGSYFANFNGLNLDFKDAKFSWMFWFRNIFLGVESSFYNTDFWSEITIADHHLMTSLQGLYVCFKKSSFDVDADALAEKMRELRIARAERYKQKQPETANNPHSILLTEKEMCEIAGIGVFAMRKRRTKHNNEVKKYGSSTIFLPQTYLAGRNKYTREEAEKFHEVLKKEYELKKSKK